MLPKADRPARILGFWFLLAFLVLVANAIVSIRSVQDLIDIAKTAIRTRDVLASLTVLQGAVTDAETGQRGYLLSRNPNYLSDFENGAREAPVAIRNLESLAAGDEVLLGQIAPLKPDIAEKLAELAETIRLEKSGRLAEAVGLVKSDKGRDAMERIRNRIRLIEGSENGRLRRRDAQAEGARTRTAGTIAIASACAAAMIALAFVLTRIDAARREKAAKEIAERENRYRFLADSLPQIVWTARPDGKLDYFNRPWFDYSGLDLDRSVGDGWAGRVHPDDVPGTYELWSRSLATGSGYQREFRLRRASDASYRWHLARALPYRDDSGAIIQWVGTVTDIDDQRRQTERLRDMNEELERRVSERTAELSATNGELERSNRELQEFASVASHDLQEPLRKIQAFGDRLRTRSFEALGDQGRDYLDRMQASAARMSTLINDLLSFSRVTTKAQPFARVDLNEIAREVLGDLEARVSQTGGEVEVGPLPTLEADPLQMRQLIQNLVGNALKFRRPEAPPRVRLTAESLESIDGEGGGPAVLLKCEDNGIGFDEKYLDRIFNVFQRLHGRSEYEGTGMGLAICRKIVERHGGRITARSAPGRGATFLISLPVTQESAEEAPK